MASSNATFNDTRPGNASISVLPQGKLIKKHKNYATYNYFQNKTKSNKIQMKGQQRRNYTATAKKVQRNYTNNVKLYGNSIWNLSKEHDSRNNYRKRPNQSSLLNFSIRNKTKHNITFLKSRGNRSRQPTRVNRIRCPLYQFTSSLANFDYNSSQYCKMDDYRYGQWVPGSHKCGLSDNYTYPRSYRGQERPFPWSQWCWKPAACKPEKFSRKQFCKALAGRDMLFVGDSLLFELYSALFYQLREPMVYYSSFLSKFKPIEQWMPHVQDSGMICNQTSSLTFVRSDHLLVRNEERPCAACLTRRNNVQWKHLLHQNDILVVNKGHHVTKTEISEEEFESETRETVAYLKANASRIAIFFVTTSPAHLYCRRNSTPITTPLQSDPKWITAEDMPEAFCNYSWELYPKHDKFLVDLFKQELHAVIVDIAPMSFLRPDGHAFAEEGELSKDPLKGDCLHYRLPAAPDSWAYVLFNLLLVYAPCVPENLTKIDLKVGGNASLRSVVSTASSSLTIAEFVSFVHPSLSQNAGRLSHSSMFQLSRVSAGITVFVAVVVLLLLLVRVTVAYVLWLRGLQPSAKSQAE